MSIIDDLKNNKEFKKLIINLIEVKEQNGIKYVPEDFEKKIDQLDPLDLAEKFLGASYNDNKEVSSLGILNMHIKEMIREEIMNINGDFSTRTVDFNEYVERVKLNGFNEIYNKEYDIDGKKEREIILYHPRYSILCQLDSCDENKVNSSNIYFNFKEKNNEYTNELQMSRGYIPYTNTYEGSLDMRDQFNYKLFSLIKNYDLQKEWKNFDTSLYSYLSHKKVDISDDNSWGKILKEKVESFPDEIKTILLSKNIIKENNRRSFEYYKDKDMFLMDIQEIDEKELNRLLIKNELTEGYTEKNPEVFLSKGIRKKIRNSIDDNFIIENTGVILNVARNKVVDIDRSKKEIKKVLSELNKKQKEKIIEKIDKFPFLFRNYDVDFIKSECKKKNINKLV